MPRLPLILSLLALAVAGAALVLELTRPADVGDRIFYVSHITSNDDIDDKEAKVTCPGDSLLLGGGFAVQHGHNTPGHSIAVYQGYPVANGWDVQAHETDPETERRWPWDVTGVAICLER